MGDSKSRSERRAATAQRILDAARVEFGEYGEDATTVRGIARRAGVDPSLVLQHYGSKQALFSLAVKPADALRPGEISDHLAAVLEVRLRELPPATRALMRSMLTSPEAAAVMRDYLHERASTLAAAMNGENGDAQAAAIVSSILGVTIARHFLELPGLMNLTDDQASSLAMNWSAMLAEMLDSGD